MRCAIERQEEPDLTFKIGVHSGRVAAGVVGITLYIIVSLLALGTLTQGFDLWEIQLTWQQEWPS